MICPKCGYQRTEKDDKFTSQEECPKCGLIYKKYKEIPSLETELTPLEEIIEESPDNVEPIKKKRNFLKLASVAVLAVSVPFFFYNKRSAAQPKNQIPYHQRDCLMLEKLGRIEEASKCKQELMLKRDKINEAKNKCFQLRKEGRIQEALKCENQLISMIEKEMGGNLFPKQNDHFGNEKLDSLYHQYNQAYFAGRLPEAIKHAENMLTTAEKELGENHPLFLDCINILINLNRLAGRPEKNDSLYERTLSIVQKTYRLNSTESISSFYYLVLQYNGMGEFGKAESLCRGTLAKFEKEYGADHPSIVSVLNILGEVYFLQGDLAKIVPIRKRSLEINVKAHGPNHPAVATSLKDLSMIYNNLGDHAKAQTFFERFLSVSEKAFDPTHPGLAISYAFKNMHEKAHQLMMETQEIENRFTNWMFSFTSEENKMALLALRKFELNMFLSHVSQFLIENPSARKNAFNIWLKTKGMILEAQKQYQEAIIYSDNKHEIEIFRELSVIRSNLSKLTFKGPGKEVNEAYRNQIAELNNQKEKLEARLSMLNYTVALKQKISKIDCEKLAGTIPENSVLIDFASVDWFDFKNRSMTHQVKPTHYLAFVLFSGKGDKVELIDLGEVPNIDSSISKLKKSLYDTHDKTGTMISESSKNLYHLVFKPIQSVIGDVKTIFISPDGNLNLLPFEVLQGPDGKFLIEDYTFNYLSASRDILEFNRKDQSANSALLMGDPDFGFQSAKKPKADDSEDIAKNQYQRSVDLNELNLGPLKYAKEEIEEIALVIGKGKAGLFTGKDATEERLSNSKAPRILHLATHGFFLQDQDINNDFKNTNRGWDMKPGSSGETSSTVRINRQISIESPLLRSGILLAGAVSSIRSGDVQKEDGIVTAEKILGLNLHGTEMVVLSACDTGLGEVKAGEGVFGLRRAFSQAGAKSVVMSMWKVPDSETKEMMIQFYKNIYGSKMNRCQALREAALNQIRIVKGRYGYANPLYWGGFVFVGES